MNALMIAMSQPGGGDSGQGMMSTLIFFGLIFLIFYFMILRPQQKRTKERTKMLDAVKKGDKIVTSGGLHGKVVNVDEKTLLIDVGDNTKLKFERSAVSAVTREGSGD